MTLQPVQDGTLFPASEASLGSCNLDTTRARKRPSFTLIVVESINGSNAEAGETLHSLATDPLIIVANESAAGTDRTTRLRWHNATYVRTTSRRTSKLERTGDLVSSAIGAISP